MNAAFRDRRVDWSLTAARDRALDATISSLVRPGEKVLDLGCGRGDLLVRLRKGKEAEVRGIELDGEAASEAIARGLSVLQGPLEEGLDDLGNDSFDLVVLNQVLPVVKEPAEVLAEALRVGKRVIATFPNFAWWGGRFSLFFRGRLPVTPSLPYQWYDTPNIRLVTVKDFRALCRRMGAEIVSQRFAVLDRRGGHRVVRFLPNLRASLALFEVRKTH